MCLIAAHREAALPGVRGNVFLADGGDLDIIAALDEANSFRNLTGSPWTSSVTEPSSSFFHPAGQLQLWAAYRAR